MVTNLNYFVYIVECSDKTLYTGYTSNLTQRLEQHNSNKQGARYTRMRRPVKLVFYEISSSRNKAMKREKDIKKLSRVEKLNLIKMFKINFAKTEGNNYFQ